MQESRFDPRVKDPVEEEVAIHSSCLENPTDRGIWWATGRGVIKNRTRLRMHTHKKPLYHIWAPAKLFNDLRKLALS